jgi:hypothetical protein
MFLSDDVHHGTRRRATDVLTYLDDFTRDFTVVKYSTGANTTNIQMVTQRLEVLERRMSRINTAINRSLLRRDRIQLGINATATGKLSVQIAGFVVLVLVASLTFILTALRDSYKLKLK